MLPLVSRPIHPDRGIGAFWCSLMHDSPKWPIHGRYECRVCGRRYRVPWSEPEPTGAPPMRHTPVPALSSLLVPALLLLAVLTRPGWAAERKVVDSSPAAAVTLERFLASQQDASRWPLETIEIEASLPKLQKTGRLRAIRRLLRAGHAEYHVLDIAGDRLVEKQVIVRYVSAEERAAEFPAQSVAITPANYRIRYVGLVQLQSGVAYAFRIVPRKKREGLINGVIWLDGDTGILVRESGYLAKSPSIFLKRVNLTREIDLRDGAVEARTTHVSIDTRLVGRAQLMIVERPSSDEVTDPQGVIAGQ